MFSEIVELALSWFYENLVKTHHVCKVQMGMYGIDDDLT